MKNIQNSSTCLYSFILDGNVAWASTTTNLAILLRHQNHVSRIVYFKDKYSDSKLLMNNLNALNIYQLNIYQIILFMHEVKHIVITCLQKLFHRNKNQYNNVLHTLCQNKTCSIRYFLWRSILVEFTSTNIIAKYIF